MTNISVLDRFQRAQRTVSWRNTHDTECPAFGLVEVTGYTTGQDGRVVVKGSRPDGGTVIGINGSTRVAPDAYGTLTFDFPAVVAVSGGASNGGDLGPKSDSWLASGEESGFIAMGNAVGGRVLIVDKGSGAGARLKIGKTEEGASHGNSVNCRIYRGTDTGIPSPTDEYIDARWDWSNGDRYALPEDTEVVLAFFPDEGGTGSGTGTGGDPPDPGGLWRIVQYSELHPKIGKVLTGPVRPNTTCSVGVWRRRFGDSGNQELYETGELIEDVHHDWMTGSEDLAVGTEVTIQFFYDEPELTDSQEDGPFGIWRIIAAEC